MRAKVTVRAKWALVNSVFLVQLRKTVGADLCNRREMKCTGGTRRTKESQLKFCAIKKRPSLQRTREMGPRARSSRTGLRSGGTITMETVVRISAATRQRMELRTRTSRG